LSQIIPFSANPWDGHSFLLPAGPNHRVERLAETWSFGISGEIRKPLFPSAASWGPEGSATKLISTRKMVPLLEGILTNAPLVEKLSEQLDSSRGADTFSKCTHKRP